MVRFHHPQPSDSYSGGLPINTEWNELKLPKKK